MEKAQKEYYLNEKIKAIHQELGRKDDRTDEIEELKEKIEKAGMPKDGRARRPSQELKRLEAMPPVSAEATVSRNYIEWLVSVPWKKSSQGAQGPRAAPRRSSTRTTTASRRSRSASSSSWPCASSSQKTQALDPLLRRPSGRRQDVARQVDRPRHRTASSSASRSAACATRPRSAATAAPTSAPSPARSSR